MNKLVIFGASGAIGSYLLKAFSFNSGFKVLGLSRDNGFDLLDEPELGLFTNNDIRSFLDGAVVINCSAYNDNGSIKDPIQIDRINVNGTLNMIQQCENLGVTHFFQLSSYKALGEACSPNGFDNNSSDNPETAYGKSKSRLDNIALGLDLKMKLSILRLPLVYGGNSGTSILKIRRLVGLPLPVSKSPRIRDYLSLDNLVKYIKFLISNPTEMKVLYLQDSGSLATNALIDIIAKVDNKKPRRLPIPEALLNFSLNLPILGEMAKKLNGYSYIRDSDRLKNVQVSSTLEELPSWLIEVKENNYESD